MNGIMPRKRKVSRQTLYYRRRQAAGLCGKCGKPRNLSVSVCDECLVKSRKQRRERLGIDESKLGWRGRRVLELRPSVEERKKTRYSIRKFRKLSIQFDPNEEMVEAFPWLAYENNGEKTSN